MQLGKSLSFDCFPVFQQVSHDTIKVRGKRKKSFEVGGCEIRYASDCFISTIEYLRSYREEIKKCDGLRKINISLRLVCIKRSTSGLRGHADLLKNIQEKRRILGSNRGALPGFGTKKNPRKRP